MKTAADSNERKLPKMICPVCGHEMNFHAEKINQAASGSRQSDSGPEFREVVDEIHECPACQTIATRRADLL